MKDIHTKLLLGKILGEIYRLQSHSDNISCPASQAQIYGLLKGFERAIEEELERIGHIPEEKLRAVEDILDEYFTDEKKLEGFKGYYDIEPRLSAAGIDRGEASQILKYLYADSRFVNVIDKMNSGHSPIECKTFKLSEWDT